MRSRNEIEGDSRGDVIFYDQFMHEAYYQLMLEVLLDIRDILEAKPLSSSEDGGR